MRKVTHAMLALLGLALILPAPAVAQESQAQPKPTQSLAEAARKARERKQAEGQQKPKVFTNDNLPAGGTVNVVGSEPGTTQDTKQEGEGTEAQTRTPERGEQYWRGRFAEARKQLADAEKELDILQRELNLMNMQYYADPQKTLNEELQRTAINEHRAKIEAKQAEVARLKQGLEDLERELRAAGGPPGWARP
jgi:chromosome segregation ATPase